MDESTKHTAGTRDAAPRTSDTRPEQVKRVCEALQKFETAEKVFNEAVAARRAALRRLERLNSELERAHTAIWVGESRGLEVALTVNYGTASPTAFDELLDEIGANRRRLDRVWGAIQAAKVRADAATLAVERETLALMEAQSALIESVQDSRHD